MMRRIIFALATVCLSAGFASCSGEKEGNRITELRLITMKPSTGYSGEVATVYGSNFGPDVKSNAVLINGAEGQILNASTGEIRFILPENEPGSYSIKVVTDNGEIEGLSFTYLRQPSHSYVVSTYAGTGSRGTADGIGTDASFYLPSGLAMAPDGSIWIADRGNNAIRRLGTDMMVTTVASGNGLNAPWQGGFDPDGNYYIASKGNSTVYKITPAGEMTTFATGINNPMGCVCDEAGNVYVASREGKKIIRYTPDGSASDFTVFDNLTPNCVYRSKSGEFYTGDSSHHVIYQVSADGKTQKIIAGDGASASDWYDGDPGNALSAAVGQVFGIDMDDNGVIYFVDAKYHTIRTITPDAGGDYAKGSVETIAGTGKGGYGNGVGLKAIFNTPYDVMVAPGGQTIYVADVMNNVVRSITIR